MKKEFLSQHHIKLTFKDTKALEAYLLKNLLSSNCN
jgi:hypothetical protein